MPVGIGGPGQTTTPALGNIPGRWPVHFGLSARNERMLIQFPESPGSCDSCKAESSDSESITYSVFFQLVGQRVQNGRFASPAHSNSTCHRRDMPSPCGPHPSSINRPSALRTVFSLSPRYRPMLASDSQHPCDAEPALKRMRRSTALSGPVNSSSTVARSAKTIPLYDRRPVLGTLLKYPRRRELVGNVSVGQLPIPFAAIGGIVVWRNLRTC